MKLIDDFVNSSELVFYFSVPKKENYATFMDWHGPETDPVGANGFLVSRLIQTENLDNAEALRETAKAMAAVPTGIGYGLIHLVAGKGAMEADPDGTKTSVLPAWRKAVIHYVVSEALLEDEADGELWQEKMVKASDKIQPLRDITPNSGAYLNEADYNEPNWQKTFFGDNYDRLKSIKE
jgi:hypothetical protein